MEARATPQGGIGANQENAALSKLTLNWRVLILLPSFLPFLPLGHLPIDAALAALSGPPCSSRDSLQAWLLQYQIFSDPEPMPCPSNAQQTTPARDGLLHQSHQSAEPGAEHHCMAVRM